MTNKKVKIGKNPEIEQKIMNRQIREKNERIALEEDRKYKSSGYTLWNNPMVDSAKSSMSEENLNSYKIKGESLYNSINFVDENGKSRTDPEVMIEGLSYVINSIKSGMHISYLDEDEVKLLKEFYGDKWYEKFGYEIEDTYRIKNAFPILPD